MKRVNIQTTEPKAYQALFGLEQYLSASTLPKALQELVRLRASLINQCHFCISMHAAAAGELGISPEKIDALSDWSSSTLFDDEEKAALNITDHVTNLSLHGLPDNVYVAVSAYFSEEEIAQLIMLIVTINAWNRVAVSTAIK